MIHDLMRASEAFWGRNEFVMWWHNKPSSDGKKKNSAHITPNRPLPGDSTVINTAADSQEILSFFLSFFLGLQSDQKKPPPRGCFLFTMFPDQEPGGRGPPLKNHPHN